MISNCMIIYSHQFNNQSFKCVTDGKWRGPIESGVSPAVREHWTHADILLFIMSHAWASAYAKIGNSNKKRTYTHLTAGWLSRAESLAQLKCLAWNSYWTGAGIDKRRQAFLHFKENLSASQICFILRVSTHSFNYVDFLTLKVILIDHVHSLTKD